MRIPRTGCRGLLAHPVLNSGVFSVSPAHAELARPSPGHPVPRVRPSWIARKCRQAEVFAASVGLMAPNAAGK